MPTPNCELCGQPVDHEADEDDMFGWVCPDCAESIIEEGEVMSEDELWKDIAISEDQWERVRKSKPILVKDEMGLSIGLPEYPEVRITIDMLPEDSEPETIVALSTLITNLADVLLLSSEQAWEEVEEIPNSPEGIEDL